MTFRLGTFGPKTACPRRFWSGKAHLTLFRQWSTVVLHWSRLVHSSLSKLELPDHCRSGGAARVMTLLARAGYRSPCSSCSTPKVQGPRSKVHLDEATETHSYSKPWSKSHNGKSTTVRSTRRYGKSLQGLLCPQCPRYGARYEAPSTSTGTPYRRSVKSRTWTKAATDPLLFSDALLLLMDVLPEFRNIPVAPPLRFQL